MYTQPQQSPELLQSAQRGRPASRLLWLDLEMTGLDVEYHLLLEVGVVVTDWNMVVQERYHRYVHREYADLRVMSHFARQTFSKMRGVDSPSLIQQCVSRGYTEEVIDMELSSIMDRHRNHQLMMLSGSTVHTDRAFIKAYLPNVYMRLHHQQVDVTCLLKMVQQWCPHVLAHAPRPTGGHSALGDIEDSLRLLTFFKPMIETMTYGGRKRRIPIARPYTPRKALIKMLLPVLVSVAAYVAISTQ